MTEIVDLYTNLVQMRLSICTTTYTPRYRSLYKSLSLRVLFLRLLNSRTEPFELEFATDIGMIRATQSRIPTECHLSPGDDHL